MSNNQAGKIVEITNLITSAVEMLCKCTNFNVFGDTSSLTCDRGGDKSTVIYYGTISNEMLLQNISTWVKNKEGEDITVSDAVLKINADCPVKIDKRDYTKCPSTTINKQTGSNSAAVAVPVVLILIILVVVVLVLVAGFIYWRRRHGKGYNLFNRYIQISNDYKYMVCAFILRRSGNF